MRFQSPKRVLQEIIYLVEWYGVKEIHFEDDNLTLRRRHIVEICELILESGLDISWICPNGVRADRIDPELLALMKKAGCYHLTFGIETASPRILKNIHKDEDLETLNKAIDMTHKAGISSHGFFIFGLPGETRETISETINFVKRSKLTRA